MGIKGWGRAVPCANHCSQKSQVPLVPTTALQEEQLKRRRRKGGGRRIPAPPIIPPGCTAALLCPFPQPLFLKEQRGLHRDRERSEDKQEPIACGMGMLREGMETLKAFPWSNADALGAARRGQEAQTVAQTSSESQQPPDREAGSSSWGGGHGYEGPTQGTERCLPWEKRLPVIPAL